MIDVQFPKPAFQIKMENGTHKIFDGIRKTWLVLTEEEWVRQNFVSYLVDVLRIPVSMIALEKTLKLNELSKRFDVLVYDRGHQPWMMVECKAPSVSLSNSVLEQILRYNISIPVSFLVLTNGSQTFAWQKVEGKLVMIDALPVWESSAF